MEIITNNKPRPMLALADLPRKAQKDFDYLNGEDAYSPRFVKYKGGYIDCFDMQSVTRELGFDQFKGWDGIASDTFFSGVLVRLCDDEQVIVGRYFS